MKKTSPSIKYIIATLWSVFAFVGLSGTSIFADIVIEPRAGGQNTTWITEIAGNWANSSATTKVAPATGGTIGSRFTTSGATFSLNPTLIVNHVYTLKNSIPSTGTSASGDVVMNITAVNATGLPASTTAFNKGTTPVNGWGLIGTLTASTANPNITFAYASGNACRTFAAAFWLQDISGCTTPAVGGIDGPVVVGQTTVNVNGVDPTATAVYVYANGNGTHATCIGTNLAPGGAADVPVTVTPLIKGQHLQGNQLAGSPLCEPSPPVGTSGPIVGGNTNANINVCLEFINGADTLIWLGASGRIGTGFGNPPTGATVVKPSPYWQKLTWIPGTSPSYRWGTATGYSFPNSGSATLTDIWFSSEDSNEMGPYTIYIDNVMNGNTVIKDWEGDALGNSAFMYQPSFATTGSTPIDNAPNSTLCVNNIAYWNSVNSQQMNYEWYALGPNSVRGVVKASGVTIPDLSQPITLEILLLPAGVTVPLPAANTLSITNLNDGTVNLTIHGTEGTAYYVQQTSSLLDPISWTAVASIGTNTAPAGGLLGPYIVPSTDPQTFYRSVISP